MKSIAIVALALICTSAHADKALDKCKVRMQTALAQGQDASVWLVRNGNTCLRKFQREELDQHKERLEQTKGHR